MQIDITYILNDLIKTLVGVGAAFLIKLLIHQVGIAKIKKAEHLLETKSKYAKEAVQFVEQVWHDLDGEDKLSKATDWLVDQLNSKGIKIDHSDVVGFVESAVKSMKSEFKTDMSVVK